MTRHLKLFAALLVVLLAISGFSPARSSGGGKSRSSSGGSSSGGGGCSSDKSSSHNYRHDDDDDDYGSSSSSSGRTNSRPTPTRSPSTTVVTCAGDGRFQAEYRVRNRNAKRQTYTLHVDFLDAQGALVDEGSEVFSVAGSGSTTVTVGMDNPDLAAKVASCEVDRIS